MCHNSALESKQIDKCIENGMPFKIIKTLKHTMRKRAAAAATRTDDGGRHRRISEPEQSEDDSQSGSELVVFKDNTDSSSKTFQMKCPFAHGLITPPRALESPLGAESEALNMYGRLPTATTTRQSDELSNTTTVNASGAADITNLSGHFKKTPGKGDVVYHDDILAKSTQFTKRLTFHMQQAIRCLQTSKTYTLLTKTTQPVHVVAICILSFVLLTVWPEMIDGTSTRQTHHILEKRHDYDPSANRKYMLALIAYLGAFSTHFGAQIWMTFVSGLSLYFSLPRHMFGQCQQILFPKYFAMNGMLSITMLILYVKFFLNSWTLPQCIQLGALAVTGAIEVVVRLYLAPPLLRLMHEKYKIEGTIGSGKEVGSLVQGDLIQCPHYQRIHKAFRRTHMTVAIGNLITMAASCLHLYYIAGQIQISL